MVQCCDDSIWASRVCAVCCVQLRLSTTLRGMLFFSDVKDQATAVWPKRRNANSFFWCVGGICAAELRLVCKIVHAFARSDIGLHQCFFLFSIHYITNYITLYLLFVSVSCIVFRVRSARKEVSIVLPRVHSLTSHCSFLFRSTFSLIHIINQSLIYLPSWCYNNSSCTPSIDLLFPSI